VSGLREELATVVLEEHVSGSALRLLPPGHHVGRTPGRALSYLDDGRQCVWEPRGATGHLACDAERCDRPVREALARRHGLSLDPLGFAAAWTRCEVAAKLEDRPIAAWLAAGGDALARARAHRPRTLVLDGGRVVVSVARAAG
jgi:hypothetical protein